jgi:hypothetical protein
VGYRSDQLRSYYPIGRGSKKWWKYLLWFVLEVCLCNAFILYTETLPGPTEEGEEEKKKDDHLKFRLGVARGLIGGFSNRRKGGKRTNEGVVVHGANVGAHQMVRRPQGERKKVCVQCSAQGRKTPRGRAIETIYKCGPCNVSLCAKTGCFAEFHAQHMA